MVVRLRTLDDLTEQAAGEPNGGGLGLNIDEHPSIPRTGCHRDGWDGSVLAEHRLPSRSDTPSVGRHDVHAFTFHSVPCTPREEIQKISPPTSSVLNDEHQVNDNN